MFAYGARAIAVARDRFFSFFSFGRRTPMVYGLDGDGWITPTALIIIDYPKRGGVLELLFNVPSFLPIKYPLKIVLLYNGETTCIEAEGPGKHRARIVIEEKGVVEFCCAQWFVPADLGESEDQRSLSVQLLAIKYRKLIQTNYELRGLEPGGWLTSSSMLHVQNTLPGKELSLCLEIPEQHYFKAPLRVTAVRDGHVINALAISKAGIYDLALPLDAMGAIRLIADDWIEPFSKNLRWCRVVDAKTRNKASGLITNHAVMRAPFQVSGTLDGWLTPATFILVDRSEVAEELTITLDVPSGPSCDYPLQVEICGDRAPIRVAKIAGPGRHVISMPLDQRFLVGFKCSHWFDAKKLGLTQAQDSCVFARIQDIRVEKRGNGSASYYIFGRDSDGWMAPNAGVKVRSASAQEKLVLKLELPGWLAFKFPLMFRILGGKKTLRRYEFQGPGWYDIEVPLNTMGIVNLKCDQWFPEPRASSDRLISYRVTGATVYQSDAYELLGSFADGWMMSDASVQINRADPNVQLVMTIEVQGWLSFPLNIRARLGEDELQTIKVSQAGQYEMKIPLDRAGRVDLNADQWVTPANLGTGLSDQRELSYRVVSISVATARAG